MERFAAFENATLQSRMQRLLRAERDLETRIQFRMAEIEADGRWVPSDPIYQRLAAVLRQVRGELRDIGREYMERSTSSSVEAPVTG